MGALWEGRPRGGIFCKSLPWAAGGGVERVGTQRNVCFIVFCKCYKTQNGSKNKMENKREGDNRVALLEALAVNSYGVGESDVRPRLIQTRRIWRPEERVGRRVI